MKTTFALLLFLHENGGRVLLDTRNSPGQLRLTIRAFLSRSNNGRRREKVFHENFKTENFAANQKSISPQRRIHAGP